MSSFMAGLKSNEPQCLLSDILYYAFNNDSVKNRIPKFKSSALLLYILNYLTFIKQKNSSRLLMHGFQDPSISLSLMNSNP